MRKRLTSDNSFSRKIPYQYWPNLLFEISYQGGLSTYPKTLHWSTKLSLTHSGWRYIPNLLKDSDTLQYSDGFIHCAINQKVGEE